MNVNHFAVGQPAWRVAVPHERGSMVGHREAFMPRPGPGTPILFLHGSWHGSWRWAEVLARVTGAGARALAVDMAGHGLRARRPAAPARRPFDVGRPATEPSPVADVDLDQASELLISQIEQLGAGDPVVVVAHSAGGAVLTRAAQLAPRLWAHAVYLTAFMPAFPASRSRRVPGCPRTTAA